MRPGQVMVGHPVDVATGIVSSSSVDVRVNGRVPLTWERSYVTPPPNTVPGPLGLAWSTRYHWQLRRIDDVWIVGTETEVATTFHDRDGAVESGEIVRNLTTFHEIQRRRSGYLVTSWDTETYAIVRYFFEQMDASSSWRLRAVQGEQGGALEVTYDSSGRLRSVEQARGHRGLRMSYSSAGLIQQIDLVLPDGRSRTAVEYVYDATHRLVSAVDSQGRRASYEYDGASRLVREIAFCGEEYFFAYDPRGRCVQTWGPAGYDRKTLRFHDHRQTTELRDSRGHVWQYRWNALGQVTLSTSPRGGVTVTSFDEHGRVTASTDALGRSTVYGFDESGNRSSVEYANGTKTVSRFDSAHRLVAITDPIGATWEYSYGQNTHWPASARLPTGLTVDFQVNPQGDLQTVENSEGGNWRYSYNAHGELTAIHDWGNASTRYEYDEDGNVTAIVDAEGNTTRYVHNEAGNVIEVVYPDGATRAIRYGVRGEVVSVVESGTDQTLYEYGPGCDQVKRVRAATGAVTEYLWGTEPGQLLGIVDPKGERYSFMYDEDGFLVAEAYPNGRVVTYTRDLCGFVTEKVNGAGERTVYDRDPVGRIVGATFHDGTRAELTYDAIGMVVRATNDAATVTIERNLLGDRVKETTRGFSVASEYDALGNRVTRRSSFGATTRYAHDLHGQVVRVDLSPDVTIERRLDGRGREVLRRFGRQQMVSEYDAAGRLLERWTGAATPDDVESRFANRPVLDPTTHRRYTYDALGNLVQINDDRWGSTDYSYDLAGHVTEVRFRGTPVERYRYDANENVEAAERLRGPGIPDVARGNAVSGARSIAPGNQVVQNGSTRYEYDGEGRLVRKIEDADSLEPKVWRFTWHPMGLLASVSSPAADEWRYSYDAFGRRIETTGPDGTVFYHWDGNAIMHEERADRPGQPSTWTFWPDNFEPLAKQDKDRAYFAVTDHLGTPREYLSSEGRVAWSARLSLWGEIAEVRGSDGEFQVRFQGQWYEDESGLHQNGLRHYSAELAAFVSMDPVALAGGLNGYFYAPNPLRFIDPHGLAVTPHPCDGQGRPTGASGTLTRGDLRPTDSSPPTIDPPGWKGGKHPDHQQRSHLVADTLGGSGSDPRNIIALTDGANHPGMSTLEGKVRRHIQQHGGPVDYEVTVNYKNNHKTPSSVHIKATDKNGQVIVDEKVVNGKRQKQACCP